MDRRGKKFMDTLQVQPSTERNWGPRHRAALLSALSMGLGQMYNRQWVKGILLFVLQLSYLGVFYDLFNMGLWGIVTLGTKPFRAHSIQLLPEGITALILLASGLFGYILCSREAYRVGMMPEPRLRPPSGG